MLRLLFVLAIILAGVYYSLQGVFYILLFYLWNGYFRPETWVWSSLVYQLRLSLAIGSMLVITAVPSIPKFRLTTETALILLFFAQSTVSWLASPYFDQSTIFWVEFLKVIVVTLLITILVDNTQRFRLTLVVVAISLGLEAAKQGWVQLIINPGATNVNTHLVLGDNNGVAMGMMMLVPVFMALAQTSKTRRERYFHRFFLVGILYRGISTYSRGGLLAAAAVGLMVLSRSKHKFRALLAVGALAAVISAAMPQTFWDRMGTIMAEDDERDASAQSRLYFWGLAVEMANDYPATGVGLNAFRFAFRSYDRAAGGYGEIRAVHSVWFAALSDLGYPGLILFVSIILAVLFRYWRIGVAARARNLPDIAAYANALQMSVVAFVVGGTFLTATYLELIWHFFGLSVALTRVLESAVAAAPVVRSPTDVEPAAAGALRPVPARHGGARHAPAGNGSGGRFFNGPDDEPGA